MSIMIISFPYIAQIEVKNEFYFYSNDEREIALKYLKKIRFVIAKLQCRTINLIQGFF